MFPQRSSSFDTQSRPNKKSSLQFLSEIVEEKDTRKYLRLTNSLSRIKFIPRDSTIPTPHRTTIELPRDDPVSSSPRDRG